jgi:hypothetical protein
MVAENRKDIEAVPQKRKEAANMRVLEAGLAILGGASPHAFVNIGKGAEGAVKGYAQDIKELDKLERDYKLQERQIRTLQNKEAAEFTKADQLRLDKAIERRDNALDKYNLRVDRLAGIMYEGEMGLYKQKAQDAAAMERTQAQIQGQLKAANIGANRPSPEMQLIERLGKDSEFAKTYRQMQVDRYAPRAEAELREEYTKNFILYKKDFPTFEDFKRAQMGGGQTKPPANRAPLSTFGG